MIFSKGHASPSFYALWAAAGGIDARELASYRQFGSRLEGHPTPRFPYAEAATGSLGQVLASGWAWVLNASRLDHLPTARTCCWATARWRKARSAFAEGRAEGFTFLALAVAAIAGSEARRSQGVTPTWTSWIAVAAGLASFVGWALGIWLGVSLGNLLWVVSSLVMCLWTLWFGTALSRPRTRS